MGIYGKYKASLQAVMEDMARGMKAYNEEERQRSGEMLYEHLLYRLKAEDSMETKLQSRGLPLTPQTACYEVRDAIGFRMVCRFIDDIYENVERIKAIPGVQVVKEKDYVRHVKPNGYRSYHMILDVTAPYEDANGRNPGHFFVEIQLRTIAMDSWAALEHEMKYKRQVKNSELISRELKRCADELASCDLSMQTIRNLIRGK